MTRFLFRVQYAYGDGLVTYEPVCIRAATESAARTELVEATKRFASAISATRTYTLLTSAVES